MKKYKIVMLGEKDHGKSTLLANLLITSKGVSQDRIKEVKAIAKKNKTRFEPGYILDAFSEERNLGMTIDTTRADIVYKNSMFEFIDVPGHIELIKNMMTGASDSEIALLVVSAKNNEGFKPETKRHLFLAMMFNVKAIVIAVNKLDESDYSKIIFEKIKKQVSDYINKIKPNITVATVPISAYNIENLISKSAKIKWYNEKSLIEMINELKNAIESSKNKYLSNKKNKNVRILVQDVIKEKDKNPLFFGLLYSGIVKKNDIVKILPDNIRVKIKSVSYINKNKQDDKQKVKNISIQFSNIQDIKRGSVIYDLHSNPAYLRQFKTEIFSIHAIDLKKDLKKIKIILNNNEQSIKNIKILKAISPITGMGVPFNTQNIRSNTSITSEIVLDSDYPLEKFNEFEDLGRFLIFKDNKFVGIGKIN